MNGTWSLYDLVNGFLAGRTVSCPEEHLDANTPSGYAPVSGRHDHLSRRVDLELLARDDDAAATVWAAVVDANRLRRTAGAENVVDPPPPKRGVATAAHVVDYQPPAPSPDHEWNGTARRWQLNPAAVTAAADRAAARVELAELEKKTPALLRAVALNKPGAIDALMAQDAQIAALEARL